MNYEKKFTPGPWDAHFLDDYFIVSSMGTIAKMPDNGLYINRGVNAHLIAAAPELLDALIECIDTMKDLYIGSGMSVITRGQEAINKALNIKND